MSNVSYSLYKALEREVTTLIVYVDDIVVTANDQCGINNLNGFLGKGFEIKVLSFLDTFLGLRLLDLRIEFSYPNASTFYIFSKILGC